MDLQTIVDKLALNSKRNSNFESIINLFDKINEKRKISINLDNEEFIILIIKLINVFEEEESYEIKLNKNLIKTNDKINILFNQMKLLNIN